jgi:hypothetical protein
MKKVFFLSLLIVLFHLPGTGVCQRGDIHPFLGQWALHLPGGAGWLEVRMDNGYPDADLLWYGGSVTPVAHVYLDGETLYVTRTRTLPRNGSSEAELRPMVVTTQIAFEIYGESLAGTSLSPARDGLSVQTVKFLGTRVPPPPAAPDLSSLKFGKPQKLLNDKNLDGWKLTNSEAANGWKVENGVLINDPVQEEGAPHIRYGNLRTVEEFEDFKLNIDVNIPEGSNSGIYLRGLYEVQVLDSYGKALDSHHMGAIYSRITPLVSAEKKAGEWQTMEITLADRHVTVVLNGTTIVDNQPLEGPTGGALFADQSRPGPIYLQGDHGKVSYRNIVLREIIE